MVVTSEFLLSLQTTLPTFQSPAFSVIRQHEDFVWLHDTLSETADYAGLIVSTLGNEVITEASFFNFHLFRDFYLFFIMDFEKSDFICQLEYVLTIIVKVKNI